MAHSAQVVSLKYLEYLRHGRSLAPEVADEQAQVLVAGLYGTLDGHAKVLHVVHGQDAAVFLYEASHHFCGCTGVEVVPCRPDSARPATA